MNQLVLLSALCLTTSCGNPRESQREPVTAFTKITTAIKDTSGLYVENGVSGNLFYYSMAPDEPSRGMLVLFPPNGEAAEMSAEINKPLAMQARDSGLVTIVLSVNHNLYLDEASLAGINALLRDARARYHVPEDMIVLGGFSLGGMNAIRYTELAAQNPGATAVHPIAVYAIDPPLDFGRLYHSFQRTVDRNGAQVAVNEASYFLERLNREFGGSPEARPDIYVQRSMFSASAPGGGNAKFLKMHSVRIYSDPDTSWWMTNRGASPADLNATEGEAMIRQLRQLGNDRAEYVNSLGKGFRPDGTRHPHSWSLAAPPECLAWVMSCMRGTN